MLGLAFAILNVSQPIPLNTFLASPWHGFCSRGLLYRQVFQSAFHLVEVQALYGVRSFLEKCGREIQVILITLNAGLLTAGICSLCMATSLAEFLSAYPTAGGQYHWVALISWDKWMPIISWITGWVNCSGWVALAATGGVLGSQLILGIVSLLNPVCLKSFFFLLLSFGLHDLNLLYSRTSPKAGISFWSISGILLSPLQWMPSATAYCPTSPKQLVRRKETIHQCGLSD